MFKKENYKIHLPTFINHSMEECDVLCARLGIMVNGQFQCFGPTPYLKHKFGQGFTILVKLNTYGQSRNESEATMNSFKDNICRHFDGCVVKDEQRVRNRGRKETHFQPVNTSTVAKGFLLPSSRTTCISTS